MMFDLLPFGRQAQERGCDPQVVVRIVTRLDMEASSIHDNKELPARVSSPMRAGTEPIAGEIFRGPSLSGPAL